MLNSKYQNSGVVQVGDVDDDDDDDDSIDWDSSDDMSSSSDSGTLGGRGRSDTIKTLDVHKEVSLFVTNPIQIGGGCGGGVESSFTYLILTKFHEY